MAWDQCPICGDCVKDVKEHMDKALNHSKRQENDSGKTSEQQESTPLRAQPSRNLPLEPADRKRYPIVTGVLDYFPDAIAEVSLVSLTGNDQHNPGQPLHWDRNKSQDQADCIGRHLLQRGTRDSDGMRHTAKVAWRALALLQLEIEDELSDRRTSEKNV